jgi:nitrogen-specific signal transduction histidine kinase/CheY-like chemotaxis protein
MALSIAGLVVMALEAARTRADEERETLQLQLAQAQKMETVGRLAGGIAHDFNNLLTVINGHSKLMLGRLTADNPLRRPVTQILKAGERAAGLTRQLLAFSSRQVLEARVIDLNSVVKGMQSILDHLMGDDVTVGLELHPGDLPVLSDAHQLEQVIMNLAVNARDAMPEGGRLRIHTALAQQDGGDAWCVLAVGDSGTGMDEATKQKIFDPFFTTKPTGTGTGLGLSIVQGIVAQTAGYIEVDTKPGAGTTFRIFLPLHSGERIPEEETVHALPRQGSETILVVEDWPDVRQYVTDVLRGYGYEVTTAADAEEALKVCQGRTSRFDLVLADVMMAGMSGIDLVARLTANQHAAKALLMSGFAEQNKTQTPMPKGAYFLPKPFSPEQLAERVQAILSAA